MKDSEKTGSLRQVGGCDFDCSPSKPGEAAHDGLSSRIVVENDRALNVDLLVIDLETCRRCVPTAEQLDVAVELLAPVAVELGIDLRHHQTVVQTAEEARELGLLTSPTIRLNGRDITQDIRESECESCGDLAGNNTSVDCREWHYRGDVYSAAPLPLLLEAIIDAMLNLGDLPPVTPAPLEALPENLQRYFENKGNAANPGCCS